MNVYYFDTCIWLDLWELRDELNFPRGKLAEKLVRKIVRENGRIVYSDLTLVELQDAGYTLQEITERFRDLRRILEFVQSTEKQIGRAAELSQRREVPRGDALHALIARNERAALVTYDLHFQRLKDITDPKTPREISS